MKDPTSTQSQGGCRPVLDIGISTSIGNVLIKAAELADNHDTVPQAKVIITTESYEEFVRRNADDSGYRVEMLPRDTFLQLENHCNRATDLDDPYHAELLRD